MRVDILTSSLFPLLIFIGIVCSANQVDASHSEYSQKSGREKKNTIIIYYFHQTIRCPTCLMIEEITTVVYNQLIRNNPDSARIKLEIVDISLSKNLKYVRKFPLRVPQGVVIAEVRGGRRIVRWKNCDKIWDLAVDPGQLLQYLQSEIEVYL